MKATRRTMVANVGKAGGRRFWHWPLAFALTLAIAASLFHDLPALAGGGGSGAIPVAVASSTSEAPDPQAPGHGCHCLCHMTAQATVSSVVIPVIFSDSISPPRNGAPTRSWAGLPPFRPPRV
jgi:hypothetical protein